MPFYRGKPQLNAKKEAQIHAEIFGRQQEQEKYMQNQGPDLSISEVEKMRTFLMEYDRKNNTANAVIDLSKPPVVPYEYRKFPKVVYDHASNKPAHNTIKIDQLGQKSAGYAMWHCNTKNVNSEEELAQALADGWQEKPPEHRYAGQNDGQEIEVETATANGLPDFSSWDKKRIAAYGKAMFDIDLDLRSNKEEIIAAVEQAAGVAA